ncbi:MAG TPA: polyprenyl synthetase family protein [Patescibacteria group bacterium]|nr:polyprenyl synthetase family protein [Patescibacteria group bacterium]
MASSQAADSLTTRLKAYKQAIDDDIVEYAAYTRAITREQFGPYAALEIDAFLNMLAAGGKRIRGSLVMLGYEMSGGKDRKIILPAARAIEMLHAYMLILDDIQDRSSLRRGKPTVHKHFEDYHRQHHLKGDAEHAGLSLAINSALAGAHAAQIILSNLNADPQLRLNVLSIVNRTLMITCHGQMNDMMNELVHDPSMENVERVLQWKTALYTFVNPLHVGMVLAGADCHATDAITPYATHLGCAFQITDDILGIFGDRERLGKSPMDDMREGKGTVLSVYALKHALPDEKLFLKNCLGKQDLAQAEFERCKKIITDSGALYFANKLAAKEIDQALDSLSSEQNRWPAADVKLMHEIASSIQDRQV